MSIFSVIVRSNIINREGRQYEDFCFLPRHQILAATALAGGPAVAQQKAVFKASDVHPAGYPTVVAVENLGKKLDAATNGQL